MATRSLIHLLSFVLILPAFGQRVYPPRMANAETKVYKTIGEVSLDLHIFKPEGWKASDTRPAIVFFFGGGWNSGTPGQFEKQCEYLANRGMVAVTADYRVRSRHDTRAKDCVADARDAMRWVREQARELGIDPRRLAAGGGSAGGHIAACLGTITSPEAEATSSRPDAMALFNPACVLAPMDGFTPWKEDRSTEMRERMGADPVSLSPAHHVTASAPPCILFHGTADPTVPFSTAELFARTMNVAGARCDLMAYAGEAHGFFNYGKKDNAAFEKTMAQLDAFLVELEWLE